MTLRTGDPNQTEYAKGIFEIAPFIKHVGYRLTGLGYGWAESTLELRNHHRQQDEFVHAGVLATMADHTAGAASDTVVEKGKVVLTIEFKINFLRPAMGETLRCRSDVIRPGRSIVVTESNVFALTGDDEKLVAKAMVTLAVVPKPQQQIADGEPS
jgi:uncharacterized protein (TIGR00369 family)